MASQPRQCEMESKKEKLSLIPESSETDTDLDVKNASAKGVTVVWKNLNVVAHIKKENLFKNTEHTYKPIIHNINGALPPGNLVAILGASGSGKSTLMSVLANRNPGNLNIDGDIRIDGHPMGTYMRHISGFVYQDDIFLPLLTVTEHLNHAAHLRMGRNVSSEKRKRLVNKTLSDLGLLKRAHTRIGGSSLGQKMINLSGGEQKRLSVATELLIDPALLFCDEPTTGLDSYTALQLITTLRKLANDRNKTIMCSIHQPSAQIFELFHQIILLHRGRIAFIGKASDGVEFFKSQGIENLDEKNQADFFVQSLAVIPNQEEESLRKLNELCDEFEKSKYFSRIEKYITADVKPYYETRKSASHFERYQEPYWIVKFFLVLFRTLRCTIRDISVLKVRLIEKVVVSILFGLCLHGTVNATQMGVQALFGLIANLVAEIYFTAAYASMSIIPSQAAVFMREYSNGTNSSVIFYLSNAITMIPSFFLDPFVFTVILYYLVGLQPTIYGLLMWLLIGFALVNVSTAFGLLLSMAFKKSSSAAAFAVPFECILIILSGVFVNLRTVPIFIRWVRFFSWLTFSTEAYAIVQLQGVNEIACSPNPNLPCYHNAHQVLQRYDFQEEHLWYNIISMVITYLVIHILTFVFFINRVRTKTL